MMHDSKETIIKDKTIWTTEVTHDQSYSRIRGTGTASTKSTSQEQAAKYALEFLAQNLVGATAASSATKISHTT